MGNKTLNVVRGRGARDVVQRADTWMTETGFSAERSVHVADGGGQSALTHAQQLGQLRELVVSLLQHVPGIKRHRIHLRNQTRKVGEDTPKQASSRDLFEVVELGCDGIGTTKPTQTKTDQTGTRTRRNSKKQAKQHMRVHEEGGKGITREKDSVKDSSHDEECAVVSAKDLLS
ncbi:hypothetical protein KGM_202783 [Danaus plexippus plexippus]|uniref:Uncharacterized protein n=1 Tax=Danaus plexippus plexippus TaxID=278856 RepID=A0A212EIH9_DANPL|nr:hypothetical protein KGM_202783 [Danaus plexippus plexippus]